MRTSLLSTSAFVVLTACSSDPPAKPHGTVSGTSARTSITSIHDVSTAMASGSASSAAGAVMALTAAGESVVTPSSSSPRIALPTAWPKGTTRESLTGSATCTPDSCTFDNYGDSDSYGSYLLNGTITDSGDTLTFDLTLDVTTTEGSLHWTLDGSLTVTPALIDGSVHSHGSATGSAGSNAYDVTWDVDVDFRSIGLDSSGCPVSGSLSAAVSFQDASATYSAQGTASFGPACGDVTFN